MDLSLRPQATQLRHGEAPQLSKAVLNTAQSSYPCCFSAAWDCILKQNRSTSKNWHERCKVQNYLDSITARSYWAFTMTDLERRGQKEVWGQEGVDLGSTLSAHFDPIPIFLAQHALCLSCDLCQQNSCHRCKENHC